MSASTVRSGLDFGEPRVVPRGIPLDVCHTLFQSYDTLFPALRIENHLYNKAGGASNQKPTSIKPVVTLNGSMLRVAIPLAHLRTLRGSYLGNPYSGGDDGKGAYSIMLDFSALPLGLLARQEKIDTYKLQEEGDDAGRHPRVHTAYIFNGLLAYSRAVLERLAEAAKMSVADIKAKHFSSPLTMTSTVNAKIVAERAYGVKKTEDGEVVLAMTMVDKLCKTAKDVPFPVVDGEEVRGTSVKTARALMTNRAAMVLDMSVITISASGVYYFNPRLIQLIVYPGTVAAAAARTASALPFALLDIVEGDEEWEPATVSVPLVASTEFSAASGGQVVDEEDMDTDYPFADVVPTSASSHVPIASLSIKAPVGTSRITATSSAPFVVPSVARKRGRNE